MATITSLPRLALRPAFDPRMPDGAWWPENRRLGEQLGNLFALWPPEAGRISRVVYSPPDWDDHPHSVTVPGRTVKTGSFPRDDTHLLTLSMRDGHRRSITVIPPDTPTEEAEELLNALTSHARSRLSGRDDEQGWENEGGQLSR
jgi:Family of unknown function (DUF5994)